MSDCRISPLILTAMIDGAITNGNDCIEGSWWCGALC